MQKETLVVGKLKYQPFQAAPVPQGGIPKLL